MNWLSRLDPWDRLLILAMAITGLPIYARLAWELLHWLLADA